MTNHEQRAKELFLSGYNCAQAVFAAFAPELGMDERAAAKLASSFGGGMAGMREVCGAVSGMLMAAGALYGYDDPSAREEKKLHYAHCRAMADAFRAENGSIVCRELLGLDRDAKPAAPSERTAEYYKKRPCAELVAQAAAILDEYMRENPV